VSGGGGDDSNDDETDARVRALQDELAAARAESADRWAAIERLAPAAKALRLRAQQQAERLTAMRRHLEAMPVDGEAEALAAWREAARRLLGADPHRVD
jgi:hypothetical protein